MKRPEPLLKILMLAGLAVCAGADNARAKYDWLQYSYSPDKTANNTAETIITSGNVSQLTQLFKVALQDNADGAPVLLTGVSTPGGTKDLIFVQGERSRITAFDANTGAQIWTQNYDNANHNINNAAPAIDPNRQFIYLDTFDKIHKLNVGDGSEVTGGIWPIQSGPGKASCETTIAVASNGKTYFYCANQQHGRMFAVNCTDNTFHIFNNSQSNHPDTIPTSGQSGCNPWARAITFYSTLNRVLCHAGSNGSTYNGTTAWGESYVALPPDGTVSGGLPIDSYTPSDWSTLNSNDTDMGTGNLIPLPNGISSKFPHMAVIAGKDKRIQIINLDNMSGQGGPGHTGGQLFMYDFSATMSYMRDGSAVWTNPSDNTVWYFVGGLNGIAGFKVNIDGSGNPSLSLQWTLLNDCTTTPLIANDVLFCAAGGGEHTTTESTHQIEALNPTTGAILWKAGVGQFHWQSPIVANGIVYFCDGNSGGFGSGTDGHLIAWHLSSQPSQVADPTFSPPAGSYSTSQSVTISTTTGSASIRYTTDGSTPSETAGTLYTGPVTINSTTTLKAIAYESGMSDSSVVSGTYTINSGGGRVAAPTFSPVGGTYTSSESVTISTTTGGASIRYTTDGTTPSETAGTLYTGPVTITAVTTLKAIAYESGMSDSSVTTDTYTINPPPTTENYVAGSTGHITSGPTATTHSDPNAIGGQWVSLDSTAVGDYIEYHIGSSGGGTNSEIPIGIYTVQMGYVSGPGFGALSLALDGVVLGTLDQYAPSTNYPTANFGTVSFATQGEHILRLTVTGKNASSSGYSLSQDNFNFTAHAISINFSGTGGSGTNMAGSEAAGVVSVANWNNAATTSGNNLALNDSSGASSGATVTWSDPKSTGSTGITNTPGDFRMMKFYLDASQSTTTTVTVASLPANSPGYQAYLYIDGNNSETREGAYTISGSGITTTTIKGLDIASNDFSGTYTQANDSPGNYVVFNIGNVSAFTIKATAVANGATYPRAPINGIQAVPKPNVAPPPAPTNLSATGGNAQVALSWMASSGASSYNVYRSTTSGGPYSQVATGITSTNYTDSGVANGTTYYYVVTAVNLNGESGSSNQTSATPGGSTVNPISINFSGTGGNGTNMASSETAGVVPLSHWNNAVGLSGSNQGLNDSTGVASGAMLAWSDPKSYNSTSIANTPGDFRMMKFYLDASDTTTTTVTVSSLPSNANGYRIYIYFDGANGASAREGAYTISGSGITTTTINGIDNASTDFNGTYILADNSAGNYLVFTIGNVASFTISATAVNNGATYLRAPLNGIQIIPQ